MRAAWGIIMVLETKHTTVAYRCPHCGAGIMSAVDVFALNADMVKLKCTCGKSELHIVRTNDGKIRLTVPCVLCLNPHNYVISPNIFFGKDLFVLPCAYSDINICFIGEMNHVKAELARSELELLDMLEKNGIDSFEALHNGDNTPNLTDPQILDIVMFVINELDEEGKIFCKCKEGEEKSFDVEVTDEGVRVCCTKCGASRLIPTDSTISAHAFLNADSLHLE